MSAPDTDVTTIRIAPVVDLKLSERERAAYIAEFGSLDAAQTWITQTATEQITADIGDTEYPYSRLEHAYWKEMERWTRRRRLFQR